MQYQDNKTDEQKLSQLMDGEWHELNPSTCIAGLCEDESLRAKWSRYHMIRDVMKNEPVVPDADLASRICAAIDDEPVYSNVAAFNASSSAVPLSSQSAEFASGQAEMLDIQESASELTENKITSIGEAKSASGNGSMFKTGVTGFALAASVALVTVVGMNIWQNQGSEQNNAIASASPQTVINDSSTFVQQSDEGSLPVVEFVSNTGSYWVSPETTERVTHEHRLNMMLSQHIENSPTSGREGLLPYSRLVGYDERALEQ